MSEFKFTCPVCGQSIKCESWRSNSMMECPSCFQRVIVPQAPADDMELVIEGSKATKRLATKPELFKPPTPPAAPPKNSPLPTIAFVVLLCAAITALFVFYGKIFKPNSEQTNQVTSEITPAPNEPQIIVAPIQQESSALLCDVQKAVCYSGFRHGQHPDRGGGAVNPSDKEILGDLQILSRNGNFSLIRLYDSQANSEAILRLIKDHEIKTKVMLGAWLAAEVSNPNCPWHREPYPAQVLEANKLRNAKEIENAIRLANQYSNIVVAVSVGNEALVDWSDHIVPLDSIIRYVRQVKKSISQPVTVADNYAWWSHYGAALANELDFICVHTYPIWENKDIDQAMPYTIANIQAVRNALPHSRIVITEAGWATIAGEFGPRASEENQKNYYHDLYDWADKMNITTFFFEAFDEDWKGDPNNTFGAEKHWGLFTIDRKAKMAMYDLYPDLSPVTAVK